MTELESIQLNSAEQAYLVANTPLFLLRKLKEDTEIANLSHSASGEDLLRALKNASHTSPSNISDIVRPFIFLVALANKNDLRLLIESTTCQPLKRNDWFDYIRRVLIETYRPTTELTIRPRPRISASSLTSSSGAANVENVLAFKR